MNHDCEHIREFFSPFLDDELSPEVRENVEAHLAVCSECLRELDGYKKVTELYAKMDAVEAPMGFEDLVRQRIQDNTIRLRSHRLNARRLWPVAAAALLLLGFVGLLLPRLEKQPNLHVASQSEDMALKKMNSMATDAARSKPRDARAAQDAKDIQPVSKDLAQLDADTRERLQAMGYLGDSEDAHKKKYDALQPLAAPPEPLPGESALSAPQILSKSEKESSENRDKAASGGEAPKPDASPTPPPVAESARALEPAPAPSTPMPSPPPPETASQLPEQDVSEKAAVTPKAPLTTIEENTQSPQEKSAAKPETQTSSTEQTAASPTAPPPVTSEDEWANFKLGQRSSIDNLDGTPSGKAYATAPPSPPKQNAPAPEPAPKKLEKEAERSFDDRKPAEPKAEDKNLAMDFIATDVQKEDAKATVADRTFLRKDDIWTEKGYKGEKTVALYRESPRYDALLSKFADLRKIAALGPNVIFKLDQRWYHLKPAPAPKP